MTAVSSIKSTNPEDDMSAPVRLESKAPPVYRSTAHRSLAEIIDPLDRLAASSTHLVAKHDAKFSHGNQSYELPRYIFFGPKGGDDPIRIGIFAAIHGDEPAGAYALVDLLTVLEAHPELAAGYVLYTYPLTNPTGFEDNSRCSRRGRDLNREFWNNSNEPEVQLLQAELLSHAFNGIVSLQANEDSDGLYGYAHGATLTQNLIEPALRAAEDILPRNRNNIIDGFTARNGIIRHGYQGVLGAPSKLRPRPFEIILETPNTAPQFLQEKALVAALLSILTEYRKFIAFAPNL
jgi:protein MpaA